MIAPLGLPLQVEAFAGQFVTVMLAVDGPGVGGTVGGGVGRGAGVGGVGAGVGVGAKAWK